MIRDYLYQTYRQLRLDVHDKSVGSTEIERRQAFTDFCHHVLGKDEVFAFESLFWLYVDKPIRDRLRGEMRKEYDKARRAALKEQINER